MDTFKSAEEYAAGLDEEARLQAAQKRYEEDHEAAKTWGGDIDLVSFEGE